MLQDQKFSASFKAWCDMDKQLCMQFIDNPFVVDPTCTTYTQLFERAHMDAFLAQVGKSQQYPQNKISVQGGRQESGNAVAGSCYNSYDKDQPRTSNSFWEGQNPTLCLQCGSFGHRASNCYATKSSCPKHSINCEWKEDKLISNA